MRVWEEQPIPAIIYMLTRGTTFELWCRPCDRTVVADVVALLDRHGYERPKGRLVCKTCGATMRETRGWHVAALQKHGMLHKLVTTDGSDFRHGLNRSDADAGARQARA